MLLAALLITAVSLYAALAGGVAWIARSSRVALPPEHKALPSLSVLVAARNEEGRIGACLRALQEQDYPPGRIEFLIADDHSSDGTAAAVEAAARRDGRLRLVRVPPPDGELQGKAHALHHAIQQATGTLLLTTDADCTPPPGWARNLAAQFADPRTAMVCGVTCVRPEGRLGRVQALDWLFLLTTAAAASEAGLPITAMGNNMAFRRTAYDDAGGYPALPPSVTEDYALFQKLHRHPDWRVRLLLSRHLRNRTEPLPTLRAAFAQRRRWARGGLHAPPAAYGIYAVAFLAHLLLLAGLFTAPLLALILLAAKAGADLLVLRAGQKALGCPRGLLRAFPLFEAFLFAYVLLLPPALLLFPRITWKGRRY